MKSFHLIFFVLISISAVISNPIVRIKNGTVEGIFQQSRNGRKIAAFMGIPYALPPLGDLRFEPPEAAESWDDVLSVKSHSNMCTQRDIYVNQKEVVGEEDCLYLNIYTPQIKISESTKKYKNYPVMIWIHGGGFISGAGNSDILGPKYLLDHEIVLVTFNYRLGALGFLSTGDLIIPGNQGMKDQAQAIRWVHENIAEFGGDPNRVTLFGNSAGGTSTHYHMLSPVSKGLFHRSISQSGVANCPWAFNTKERAKRNAIKLGQILECPTDDSKQLLNCLKKKNHIDIIATDWKFTMYDYCPIIPFRPVVEPDHSGAFLTEDPNVLLKKGKIMDIPWLVGLTAQEGAFRASRLFGLNNGDILKSLDENFETFGPVSLLCEEKISKSFVENISKIRKFYFGDRSFNESAVGVIDMYTDAWLFSRLFNSLNDYLNSLSSSMFFYKFEYEGSTTLSVLFGDKFKKYGVCHGDELQYLFPIGEQIFRDIPLSEKDNRMIDLMTNLWFNFAKTGNPTPEITSNIAAKWKPVRTNSLEYFHIKDAKNLSMKKNLWLERVEFWKSLSLFKEGFNSNEVLKDEL